MRPARVIAIRKLLRITQRALAARLGVHTITVAKWEGGTLDVPLEKAATLEFYASLNTRIREPSTRAYVKFLTGMPAPEEREQIEKALADEFNSENFWGHIDVDLAREPEGWRVIAVSDFPRDLVVKALRDGGVPVAHRRTLKIRGTETTWHVAAFDIDSYGLVGGARNFDRRDPEAIRRWIASIKADGPVAFDVDGATADEIGLSMFHES